MFSIVIPAYNNLPLLRRALESVRCQRDVTLEVIITDDSDQNADIQQYIATLHDSRISYHHNTPSLGAVPNWNSGLSKAQGDYVILMHHDEAMSTDDYLRQLQQQLQQGCDVVISNVEVSINEAIKRSHFTAAMKQYFLRHPSLLFLANAVGPCSCVAFRRHLAQPFDERLHWFVDVEWYYRLFKDRHIVYDKHLVMKSIHGHEGQISQKLDVIRTFHQDAPVIAATHPGNRSIRLMLWLYNTFIIHTKQLLRKI